MNLENHTCIIVTRLRKEKEKGTGRLPAHYLEYPRNFFGISTIHISLSDRSDMKQLTAGRSEMEGVLSLELTQDNKCNYYSRYKAIKKLT